MIDQLVDFDKRLFLWLNGFHTPWLDPVMLYISETWVWAPLHIFLVYLIFKNFPKHAWLILFAIAVMITIADQVTTSIMKPYFERLRPSHDPTLQSMVHIVNEEKGGQFGFASSHAANTFALATFFFLLFRQTKKWILLLFVWSSLVTYSRIYLGVHFPGDILVGAIVGVLAALIGYNLYKRISAFTDKKKNALDNSQ